MKRAMLVTFELTTRVIVDADFDKAMNANLEWEVAKIAADKIKANPDGYINAENLMNISTDLEDPYDPDYDKVDLHIPSTQEMIDFIKTNPKYITNSVNGVAVSFPTEDLLMGSPIVLNKTTWIDSIKIINDKHVKVHYNDPALENIGLSFVDWNDIATEVKLKILKAINYHEN